jgi:L-alanine-DL-glutamate epimerase-like enolase superfamily enzyme
MANVGRKLKITRIYVYRYRWELQDMGVDYNGFNAVYTPGARRPAGGSILTIETDGGITGEFAGGVEMTQLASVAKYLVGKNALERELIYNDLKRAMRKLDRLVMGPLDIALWDIAGKAYNAPLYELLGGWKKSLPCYASTYHGDHVASGGLSSPEAFADFAVQCREMGYPAFKIHPWGHDPNESNATYMRREVANVLEARKRVGPDMDLIIDPACEYDTWAETLKVGRACDEARFFWYEDPCKDGGISGFFHRTLRQHITTPLLIGEHVRGLEPHVDLTLAGGTDFVRADAYMDWGITGVMKIAHAAEGLGMDVELHGGGPAHRHCMAAIRNTNYYELGLVHPSVRRTKPPIYADGYSDELDAVDRRGHVPVPQGPGLGVTLDWDWLRAHEAGQTVYE